MRKGTLFLLSCFVLFSGLAGEKTPGDRGSGVQPNRPLKQPQMLVTIRALSLKDALANFSPSQFADIIIGTRGTAAANANKATGEVWLVKVEDGIPPGDAV